MKNLCIILSAIDNEYGIYTQPQRLQQLNLSVESVRKFIPHTDILLIDSSDQKPSWVIEGIESYYLGDFTDVFKVRDSTSNKGFKKTIGEVFAFSLALDLISSRQYQHVFKLAGRYQVNSNFNFLNHLPNTVTIKKATMYNDLVYLTRLWSFDFSLFPLVKTLYKNILLDMIKKSESIDIIEYAMFKQIYYLKIPVNKLDVIGVEGHFGQDGAYVID